MILATQSLNVSSLVDKIGNINSLFDNYQTILSTMGIALALTPILFIASLSYNYVNSFNQSTFEKPKFYDPSELKRTITIMILIPFIPAIIGLINGLGEIAASFFALSNEEEIENLSVIFNKILDFESLSLFNFGHKTIAVIICYITVFVFMIVKFAVMMFTGAFQVFLVAVAPLAAAFSILPFLKEQLIKLIKMSLNLAFVGLTLNLLDRMFYGVIIQDILASGTEGIGNSFFVAFLISAICFVIMIFYFLSIWLTAQYVGDPSASAILSMATTVAAAGAVLATNAAGMVGAAASSGTGAAGSVSSLGSDIAKDIAKGITKDDNKK